MLRLTLRNTCISCTRWKSLADPTAAYRVSAWFRHARRAPLVPRLRRSAYSTNGSSTNPWTIHDKYDQMSGAIEGKTRRQLFLFAEALGPLSDEDLHAKHKLDAGAEPIEVFEKGVSRGTASLHLLHLCLQSQYSRVEPTVRSRRGPLLEAQREAGMARKALRFLWTDQRLWAPFVLNAMNTQYLLCYYAIVEGLEEVILEWLFLDIETHADPRSSNLWRGTLLRSLITAHITHRNGHSADGNLKLFFEAADMRGSRTNGRFLSMWPATVELTSNFCHYERNLQDTTPKLYDRFVEFLAHNYPERDGTNLARLALHHPKTPSIDPSLRLLRTFVTTGHIPGLSHSLGQTKAQQSFDRWVRDVIAIATSTGQLEAVAWIRKHFPKQSQRQGGTSGS